jgi:hypothetical protein
MEKIFSWQQSYIAAACETDDSKMLSGILEARAAIEQRLLSEIDPNGEEFRAIRQAEVALEELRLERLPESSGASLNSASMPSQSQL